MNPEEAITNDEAPEARPSGMDLRDIYYVIFRHKWKIILFAVAGLAAAAAIYLRTPPVYESEAKLLIRYVVEREGRTVNPEATGSQIISPDPGGQRIINSEIEILRSFDLATNVVEFIGAEKVLGKPVEGDARNKAAAALEKSLLVVPLPNSSTIAVIFRHPNPEIVQQVVQQLINGYQKEHLVIHREVGASVQSLVEETEGLRFQLSDTEEKLAKLKKDLGVISLDETQKAYVAQIARIRDELWTAEADLAERKAIVETLRGDPTAKPTETGNEAKTDLDQAEEYKTISDQLAALRQEENKLLVQVTPESSLVKPYRDRIAKLEKQKKELEKENPQLTRLNAPAAAGAFTGIGNLSVEETRVAALEAKVKKLGEQLKMAGEEAGKIESAATQIAQLQRQKEVLEAKYKNYKASLDQARIDETLGPGKMPNISVVEAPTPPAKSAEASKQKHKFMLMALVAGLFGGVGLAFLIELVLDHSVRRPRDVTVNLRLPLFMTIPRVAINGYFHRRQTGAPLLSASVKQGADDHDDSGANGAAASSFSPLDVPSRLHTCYEALRDRLITHFEINNMTHKPKLIGVTGCSEGAGVTSTAAGLAAALSETGDGNVLLVDMNLDSGAAHPFYNGRPACGLSDILQTETRDPVLLHDNLSVARLSAPGDKLSLALPTRFSNLVPKLKMSDYDYIVFDMPAVSQTSVTPRVAAFMDMVLLVVESEKTNRHLIKEAGSLLAESKTDVKTVLNKYRRYVPQSLQTEL